MSYALESKVGAENVLVARRTPYKLREGWTPERVRSEAARAQSSRPFACRIKHRRRVIGDLFIADDPVEATLALIPRNDALTWCPRCGTVAERGTP